MVIPKPFSHTLTYASSPIFVPPDAGEEQMAGLHRQMQETLEKCRLKAEEALGLSNR
jgi:lysophospholipid acyltransferase (LPLAT)-like uncharacterized protein